MRIGYIRVGKSGPTEAEQETDLRSAGIEDFSADGPVYVDRLTKRKTDEGQLPARRSAIASLREGDELVISKASRLGITERDQMDALAGITERGAVLYIVATGKTYRWHPEVAEALDVARMGEMERKAEVTAKARRSAKEMGLRGGGRTQVKGALLEKAKAMWPDPSRTAKEIAAELKVPVRTLYNQLGSRGTPRFGKEAKAMRLRGGK